MLEIIKDVDLMSEIKQYDTILIGTNVYCTLGNGVQRDIALNYPYVREDNYKTKYGDITKLGHILECSRENEPTIILLYICKGYTHKSKKGETVDTLSYESLEHCLRTINKKYKGKRIACPVLGCSRFDGNGDKERVISMMETLLTDVNIVVYDYHQLSRDEKQMKCWKEEQEVKKTDIEAYYQMVKERKEEAEKRFKRNGHARY
jgi:hypothetical protein